jgi:muramoyltetrapeptide carboxypeptidase
VTIPMAARTSMTLPPRLRDGSRVALVAPAGPMAPERVDIALQRCHDYGLQPVLGAAARGRHGAYLAASDDERLRDLQQAIDDPDIDAVWALRGGYGTMRLLAGLDLARLAATPKAYIGFSDNTAVHLAMHARGVVSFHGPHAGGDMTELTERELRRTLWDAEPAGVLGVPADRPAVTLAGGVAEGPLIGGNLSLLAAMCGTPAAPRAHGAILFVEEIGEEDYRMDRAWMQLLLARALDGVAGIAFGRFTDCGADVHELLHALAAPLGVPVLADLPIGHEPDNWTLPLGIRARLDATGGTLELLEGAVT